MHLSKQDSPGPAARAVELDGPRPTSCAFEQEGTWSISFGGSGFLGLYYVGVHQCLRERAPQLLKGADRIYGSSSGALAALGVVLDKSAEFCCCKVMEGLKELEETVLNTFHPSYWPLEFIQEQMEVYLPPDVHVVASKHLGICVTRFPDGQSCILKDFASKEEVIQYYIDGAFTMILPFAECPRTITVIPFHVTADICPQSASPNFLEIISCNTPFQLSIFNLYHGFRSLLAPKLEVVADNGRQGYLDALRFLERRGLIKEPVLQTLVSGGPPAAAKGHPAARETRDSKSGLNLNWEVPIVRAEDIPDFGAVSPVLEAALQKSCLRDSRPLARFRRSLPGRTLMCLLLPYTVPVQLIYYRGKRLVQWLPDLPSDLYWMQGQARSVATQLYALTKEQLLRPISCQAPAPSCCLGQRPLGTWSRNDSWPSCPLQHSSSPVMASPAPCQAHLAQYLGQSLPLSIVH